MRKERGHEINREESERQEPTRRDRRKTEIWEERERERNREV